jgi:hypothetical protein
VATVDLRNFMKDAFLPVSNREADCLSAFLGFTTWSVEEAMCILCRIDPDQSKLRWSIEEKATLIAIDECRKLGADKPIVAISSDNAASPNRIEDSADQDFLQEVEAKIRRFRRLWNSGTLRRKNNPPWEYIRWALEKQIQVEWLEWAVTTGRFNDMKKIKKAAGNAVLAEDDELKVGRGKTALQLIGALIMSVYGTDIHADKLESFGTIHKDVNRVGGFTISEKTLRSFIQEAAEHLEPMVK